MSSQSSVILKSFHDLAVLYKQNKGKTKRRGSKSGTTKRLRPHVQGEPRMAAQIVVKMLNETIKQPPRLRYETLMVELDGMR